MTVGCRFTGSLLVIGMVTIGSLGCTRHKAGGPTKDEIPVTKASAVTPVDRLLPGELAASSRLVFGLPIPSGMRVERAFPDAVFLIGEVTLAGLVDYLQKHAQVAAPELTPSMLVFDHARIPAQGDQRSYQFQIIQRGREHQLVIRDITRPPASTPTPMSDEERWRRVGRKPNGSPLDISALR